MPAGDRHSKTEKPTPKKKKDARKKGQVARSPEIGGWLSLLVLTMVLPTAFGYAESKILAVQAMAAQVMAHPTIPGALTVLSKGLENAVLIILPFAGIIAVIGTDRLGRPGRAPSSRPRASRPSSPSSTRSTGSSGSSRSAACGSSARPCIKLGVIALFATRDIIGLMHTLMGAQPVAMGPLIDYAGAELLELRPHPGHHRVPARPGRLRVPAPQTHRRPQNDQARSQGGDARVAG